MGSVSPVANSQPSKSALHRTDMDPIQVSTSRTLPVVGPKRHEKAIATPPVLLLRGIRIPSQVVARRLRTYAHFHTLKDEFDGTLSHRLPVVKRRQAGMCDARRVSHCPVQSSLVWSGLVCATATGVGCSGQPDATNSAARPVRQGILVFI
ncbi:hypothetical protein LZ31DRAFT_77114 [Colletotrichum somersetense]|nr:hypothetical protein LZ31DRAFT_77114 [Colletotrichum somersetense]